MKKLVLTAAIACVAAIGQAATSNWGWSTGTAVMKDGYGKDGATYTPVAISTTLFLLAVADSGYTTQDALYQALNGGTKSIADIKAMALDSYTTGSDGKMSTTREFHRTDAETGTTYYYAIFAVSDDENYVYFSASKSGNCVDDPGMTTMQLATGTSANFKTTDSVTAGGWYAAPEVVPEPTTGLLVLLGIAGLALKRRRA